MSTLFIFLIVLGILVFVHELGHFYVARKNGVKVDEFGFGFPPRIGGFRKTNGRYRFFFGPGEKDSESTIYSLNWIPLGGFVKIKGEQGEAADEPDSFANKKPWRRFLILVAGVVMNFILGFVFLSIGFMAGLPVVIEKGESLAGVRDIKVQILQVYPDTPAEKAELNLGDVIRRIDGKEITSVDSMLDIIHSSPNIPLVFSIERGLESFEKTIAPVVSENDKVARIGVSPVRTGIHDYAWYQAIWVGAKSTVFMIGNIVIGFGVVLKNLILTQRAGVELAGPVGIAVLTGRVAEQGFIYLLQFIALLSINLGVINLFPFPALDGGRILFLLIEKLRRKPVSQSFENAFHATGFILLLAVMLLVTFKDIIRLF